jgi:DNA repair protein RecO (recombination protein O)
MPARETEAIILRTYPLKEADKIVSFFSRTFGKRRGVAARARRLKSAFGTTLEPLSHVRLWYFERESRDLVSIDSCELIQSYFDAQKDYSAGVACGYLAEVCEQLMPDHEPNDAVFRLLLLALEDVRATGRIWPALTYFDLWILRLAGLLPTLGRCGECGAELAPGAPAWFTGFSQGLLCGQCRSGGAWEMAPESRALAREMLRASLNDLPGREWNRALAADLRRFLEQRIETHLERKLVTRAALEQIEA